MLADVLTIDGALPGEPEPASGSGVSKWALRVAGVIVACSDNLCRANIPAEVRTRLSGIDSVYWSETTLRWAADQINAGGAAALPARTQPNRENTGEGGALDLKQILEGLAHALTCLQLSLPPGTCRAWSALLKAQDPTLLSNVWPGATAGGVGQILDGLYEMFVSLADMEASGTLYKLISLLTTLSERRLLMRLAGVLVPDKQRGFLFSEETPV